MHEVLPNTIAPCFFALDLQTVCLFVTRLPLEVTSKWLLAHHLLRSGPGVGRDSISGESEQPMIHGPHIVQLMTGKNKYILVLIETDIAALVRESMSHKERRGFLYEAHFCFCLIEKPICLQLSRTNP